MSPTEAAGAVAPGGGSGSCPGGGGVNARPGGGGGMSPQPPGGAPQPPGMAPPPPAGGPHPGGGGGAPHGGTPMGRGGESMPNGMGGGGPNIRSGRNMAVRIPPTMKPQTPVPTATPMGCRRTIDCRGTEPVGSPLGRRHSPAPDVLGGRCSSDMGSLQTVEITAMPVTVGSRSESNLKNSPAPGFLQVRFRRRPRMKG
ncbi:hypothetical protein MSTO_45670 [Mycobacterium stomatepiae]|uniref:Uncharacterized protein n=1 Tax=Mycobacterium stomatepiae TaxID=470076 RepID=A0A7I7QE03_9MYCO|nr:hypothetical protein MSTO_45670 [Mycobacterium stomatepiae]